VVAVRAVGVDPGRVRDTGHLLRRPHDALGDEEAEREVEVLTGGAHRHRPGGAVDAQLQRLLTGEHVAALPGPAVGGEPHDTLALGASQPVLLTGDSGPIVAAAARPASSRSGTRRGSQQAPSRCAGRRQARGVPWVRGTNRGGQMEPTSREEARRQVAEERAAHEARVREHEAEPEPYRPVLTDRVLREQAEVDAMLLGGARPAVAPDPTSAGAGTVQEPGPDPGPATGAVPPLHATGPKRAGGGAAPLRAADPGRAVGGDPLRDAGPDHATGVDRLRTADPGRALPAHDPATRVPPAGEWPPHPGGEPRLLAPLAQ